jgi:putative flippase GtrA
MLPALDEHTKKQLVRYFFAGIAATFSDLLTYRLLLDHLGPTMSKAISFIAGTVVAYLLQKFWTFKQKRHSWSEMRKFGSVYGISLVANVAVNRLVICVCQSIVSLSSVQFQLGWLCATGTSVILNFVGQKFWVFKQGHNTQPTSPEA